MSRLIITDLVVENFRKFDRPQRLTGLGPGLNLLAAPNEAGKSTLKAALDAALFQRHRVSGAGATQYLNQWHEAPPAVRVAFQLDGADYSLAKRFYKQQKAVLRRPDGSSVEGDAAERELQELLGFQAPERGGMRAELLGVWGLLWASQGDTIGPLAVSDTARDSLAECLAAGGVASVTGGRRGSAVPAKVREALAAYLTPGRGQPTGMYKQLLDKRAELAQALQEAEASQRELAEQTQALLTARRDLAVEQRGTDEAAENDAIQALRSRHAEAERLAQQIENATLSLSLARQDLAAAEDAAKRRQEMIATGGRLAEALQQATAHAEEANQAVSTANAALSTAENTATAAEAAAKAARAKAESIGRQRALVERHTALTRETERLRQALEAGRQAHKLRKAAEALPCTPAAIKHLRGLANEHATALAAREAAATALHFKLTPEGAATVRLNGETPAAVVDLLQPASLDLGALGSIDIVPRVQDGDVLEGRLQSASAALAETLHTLGVGDLTEAEAQAEQLASLQADAKFAAERAKTLVPEATSVADLSARLQHAETELQEIAATLDRMDHLPADELGSAEDAARSAAADADAALQAAHERAGTVRQTLALAKQAAQHAAEGLRTARSQHDANAQALNAAHAAVSDNALAERVAAADAKVTAAKANLAQLEAKTEELGTPKRIAAQLERAETAREQRRDRISKLALSIARLEEQVRAVSAKGPDEVVADARQNLERVDAEIARIERDKDALLLLDQVLAQAAKEAEARYLAPLTRQMRPYIADLLGQAELEINSAFSPSSLKRTGTQEAFGQLSAGTQEQLSVLTRLAFADVLAAQERPAVLLLDDALLYCDDVRLESMFMALERAAERFQVIIFTCHARAFDGLGGRSQRRLSIEPADPIAL